MRSPSNSSASACIVSLTEKTLSILRSIDSLAVRTLWLERADKAVWADKCGEGGVSGKGGERQCGKRGFVVLLRGGSAGYETGNNRQDQEVHDGS